jgi:hypothetical protein
MDLQWKMRGNYNARLCASLRKAADARTMENNGKNNAQNNGTVARKLPLRPVMSRPHKGNRPPPRGAGRGFLSLEFQP